MKDVSKWVEKLRTSSHVQRVHTVPTIGEQTVGHHSFNVLILCIAISDGNASVNLLQAAAYHDTHEVDGGDIPAHVLWNNTVLHEEITRIQEEFRTTYGLNVELTDKEELMLQWADKLEFAFYCMDQINMGNRYLHTPLMRAHNFMNDMEVIGNAHTIFRTVKKFVVDEWGNG